ncbi:MAG: flagellar motor stator protein MotA [candidate division Zixibacteria bacterium]|nr:flagellar motor stator protein MotA [candidate division Zixibacteria bacterium]
MLAIIGLVVVTLGVIGGFLMEGGNLMVLLQPGEFLIIGGAAIGAILAGTPLKVLKKMIAQLKSTIGPGYTKKEYLELLVMMYEIFNIARRDGILALESHFNDPYKSNILSKYPVFLKNHHAVDFMSDSMKLIVMGGMDYNDLDNLMDVDLDTHHEENSKPPDALSKIGDSLPGLGIVAAVLGIVITMGAINGPPEQIGEKVAAALVGTFLGILLSYGFVQPVASNIEHMNTDQARYCLCIKQALISNYKGLAPALAVEFARRSIFSDVRPTFVEVEEACRGSKLKQPEPKEKSAASA